MTRRRPLLPAIVALVAAAAGVTAVAQETPRHNRGPATRPSAPQVGEVAPPVKLKTLDGRREVDLATHEGKRPVVLFFGSYT